MIDNEIINALRCCADMACRFCTEQGKPHCKETVASLAWDLIQRQKEDIKKKDTEIDILLRKNESLKDEVSALRSDVERLQKANESFSCLGMLYSEIKSEARKEVVERLKEKANKTTWISGGKLVEKDYKISKENLENLLAEMEERE